MHQGGAVTSTLLSSLNRISVLSLLKRRTHKRKTYMILSFLHALDYWRFFNFFSFLPDCSFCEWIAHRRSMISIQAGQLVSRMPYENREARWTMWSCPYSVCCSSPPWTVQSQLPSIRGAQRCGWFLRGPAAALRRSVPCPSTATSRFSLLLLLPFISAAHRGGWIQNTSSTATLSIYIYFPSSSFMEEERRRIEGAQLLNIRRISA